MTAPLVPAAVIDGDIFPAHRPCVHKRLGRTPAGAAVKRDVLFRQDVPCFPHGGDVVSAAHGAIRIMEIFHMGGVATGMTPAGTGNFTFWLDVAVAAGFADELRPGTNADQRRVWRCSIPRACAISTINCGWPGSVHQNRGRASRLWAFPVQPADPRQTSFPAAIKNADVLHARIQHDLRHAGGGIYVTAIQNDGRIVTDPVLRQHRF